MRLGDMQAKKLLRSNREHLENEALAHREVRLGVQADDE